MTPVLGVYDLWFKSYSDLKIEKRLRKFFFSKKFFFQKNIFFDVLGHSEQKKKNFLHKKIFPGLSHFSGQGKVRENEQASERITLASRALG